ncbi:hypothetical protein KP003_14720 [Geomonas nitrogeniifigens]|uniref:hypothetical protein n=1 Tax=Geomonas diazotrophica TaxID=2843197 RepID=UPI001C2BEC7F|nr:hypothetical protein [Geomonas nitrogeniifigens]QXE85630.1 hypothetical protein KP003_14720 [Geomonas nitrogeniifigens]
MRTTAFHTLILLAIFFAVPAVGLCEPPKDRIAIIEQLQSGKAKVSFDKKSIVDESGEALAKETTNAVQKPLPLPEPVLPDLAATGTSSETPAPKPPKIVFCNRKCGFIEKRCYLDNEGNTICINTCEKESLICE